jgi:glyoxylase-like metal-dependent hydrolase (beta-lactamase superfamily II)
VVQACFVKGESGDLRDVWCEDKKNALWVPRKGDITWVQAKGHAPGNLILKIGKNVLVGDVLTHMRLPWWVPLDCR